MKLSEAIALIREEYVWQIKEQFRGELSRKTVIDLFDRSCAAVVKRANEQPETVTLIERDASGSTKYRKET
jgi:intein-encoded DNA endonuclease-like protein